MSEELITQDQRGRPFEAGNRGRPPGSRNKATQLLEAINKSDPDALQAIVDKTVEAAKAGKPWAIQIIFDKLFPVPKGRAVTFPMPPIQSAADVVEALNGLWQAVSNGEVTPDEASQLGRLLEQHAAALEVSDIEKRLRMLEDAAERRTV